MKKILILFLSLVMCVSFVGCGLFEDPNQTAPPSNPPSQVGDNTGDNQEGNKEENSGDKNQNSGGTPIQPIKPGGNYEVSD